jgi:excisionase family DNA binding protein
MMPQELEDYNTADETAAYLKLDADKLKRLARANKIGHIKTGRSYIFPRNAIEQWAEENMNAKAEPANPFGLTERALRNRR